MLTNVTVKILVSPMEDDNNVLLLGMVFSDQLIPPSRGQNFRDQVRCVELQNLGFKVLMLMNQFLCLLAFSNRLEFTFSKALATSESKRS